MIKFAIYTTSEKMNPGWCNGSTAGNTRNCLLCKDVPFRGAADLGFESLGLDDLFILFRLGILQNAR